MNHGNDAKQQAYTRKTIENTQYNKTKQVKQQIPKGYMG